MQETCLGKGLELLEGLLYLLVAWSRDIHLHHFLTGTAARIGDSDRDIAVTIPNSVTNIGDWAFDGVDIPTVVSLIENPFTIEGKTSHYRTFTQNTFLNATLYVPKGTIEKYKAADGWKDFSNIVELPEVLRGDANGDGEVNMDDATFVTNIILGTEEATEAADVNNDGTVNMPDAMFIVNKILNGKFPKE